jgi:nicotinate dehydrogenase subunit A
MSQQVRLNGNGVMVSVAVDDSDTPLLYVLRNELGLCGPRFGCGLGQCGACTVHIDGNTVRSCMAPPTGERLRSVPFTPEKVKAALGAASA